MRRCLLLRSSVRYVLRLHRHVTRTVKLCNCCISLSWQLVRKVWSGNYTILHPLEFKQVLGARHTQFRDFRQVCSSFLPPHSNSSILSHHSFVSPHTCCTNVFIVLSARLSGVSGASARLASRTTQVRLDALQRPTHSTHVQQEPHAGLLTCYLTRIILLLRNIKIVTCMIAHVIMTDYCVSLFFF